MFCVECYLVMEKQAKFFFNCNITELISYVYLIDLSPDTVELHLSGPWLSGSPIIRIGLLFG
jgi:hypothetical protein